MTESPTFTAGSVVRLNSGGPKMTALADITDGKLKCQWFDRNGKMHTADFDIAALSEFKKAW